MRAVTTVTSDTHSPTVTPVTDVTHSMERPPTAKPGRHATPPGRTNMTTPDGDNTHQGHGSNIAAKPGPAEDPRTLAWVRTSLGFL